jgi:preprotein translocase subunit YajC
MYIFAFIALQAGGAPGGFGGALLLPILLIGVFYFLMIMPQQRKQKKWQAMLGELKTGDKVVTSGGLRGTIVALKDDSLHLRIPPDNLRVEVTRASIVSVTTPDEPVAK